MNLQKYFEEFHDRIRLDSENEDLRKSRDAIKEKLTTSFKDYFETGDIPVPTFFDQGSYAMNTGVKPPDKEGNYDIDEGVKFNIATTQYSDPVEVKRYVRDSLSRHTELGTIIKQPCVRVIYSENGDEL